MWQGVFCCPSPLSPQGWVVAFSERNCHCRKTLEYDVVEFPRWHERKFFDQTDQECCRIRLKIIIRQFSTKIETYKESVNSTQIINSDLCISSWQKHYKSVFFPKLSHWRIKFTVIPKKAIWHLAIWQNCCCLIIFSLKK